jgi:iron complex outermembrane receptor protein
VPFELEGSGQAFYRNAGSSTHQGLETSLVVELLPGLTGGASYTWSDFTFDEFRAPGGEVFDGNRIPGVPEHLFHVDVEWSHASGLYAGWDLLYAGHFYADNANSVRTGDYVVSNLRAGFRWQSGPWSVEPFAGVNNLFDESYMSNIRLNAGFGRYYEPAPERNLYGGLRVSHNF